MAGGASADSVDDAMDRGGRLSGVAVSALVLLGLLAMPVAAGAQGAATLAELAPVLPLGDARRTDAPVQDSSGSSPRESADQPGFSAADVISPIPVTSSVTLEPTYERRANGTFNAYVKFKPVLVVESGLPFFTRIEWPIPDVTNEKGPTRAGVGDLTWLTLFLVRGSSQWGALGLGPVVVFPTASHSEMEMASTRSGQRSAT